VATRSKRGRVLAPKYDIGVPVNCTEHTPNRTTLVTEKPPPVGCFVDVTILGRWRRVSNAGLGENTIILDVRCS
jgi:hypothetical protein